MKTFHVWTTLVHSIHSKSDSIPKIRHHHFPNAFNVNNTVLSQFFKKHFYFQMAFHVWKLHSKTCPRAWEYAHFCCVKHLHWLTEQQMYQKCNLTCGINEVYAFFNEDGNRLLHSHHRSQRYSKIITFPSTLRNGRSLFGLGLLQKEHAEHLITQISHSTLVRIESQGWLNFPQLKF